MAVPASLLLYVPFMFTKENLIKLEQNNEMQNRLH